jgi:hypothetical protein
MADIIYAGTDIIDNPLTDDSGLDIEEFLIEASRWLTSFR